MTYPNLLKYAGSGVLKYISATEFNNLAEIVLTKLATDNTVGGIATSDPGSYTNIGAITDTRRGGAVGSADVTTVTQSTTTLYQNRKSADVGAITANPVEWTGTEIKELTATQKANLADAIIDYMVTNNGPGTYQIATSTPAGGTWTSVATLTDYGASGNVIGTTYLWRKTTNGSYTSPAILKTNSGGLKYLSTSEVDALVALVKDRIIATGIGQYAIQSSAPATGTWEAKGTVSNYLNDTEELNFTGYSEVNFTGTVSGVGYGSYSIGWSGTTPGYSYLAGHYEYNGRGGYVLFGPGAHLVGVWYTWSIGYYPYSYTYYTPVDYTGTVATNYAGLRVAATSTNQGTLTLYRRTA